MTILNNNNKAASTIFSVKHLNLVCLAGAVLLVITTMVTNTSALDNNDRTIRHHRTNQNNADDTEDIYVTELHSQKRTAYDDHQQQIPTCPNCLYKDDEEPIAVSNRASSRRRNNDNLRLDAIKRQILTKLGLRHKPNVTKVALMMPRKVVIETLFRAEDSAVLTGGSGANGGSTGVASGYSDNYDGGGDSRNAGGENSGAGYETDESDDFYGRTSEIISFPEQGFKVNGNRLLEFRVSPESGQFGQEFRIRAATLWLKADIRYTRAQHCRTTEIYVFKFKAALQESVKLNSRDFSRLTDYPVALYLNETQPGWQKIDLTTIVRDWLSDTPQDKLRLFIDCSCCSSMWNIHLLNNNNYKGGRYYSGDDVMSGSRGGGSDAGADNAANRPFLVIHTDPTLAKRVRRRALDCGTDSGNQCCKQRFYVSFRELGWEDWIIAPQGYYANYCRGDCSNATPLMGHHHHRTPDTYANYHTHVIEEIRKTHHLSGMQPCCAPLKFSSVSLIYFGPDSNIIKRDLPKMVVDECGCP